MVLVLAYEGTVLAELPLLGTGAAWDLRGTEPTDVVRGGGPVEGGPAVAMMNRPAGVRAIGELLPDVMARYGLGQEFANRLART